MIKVLCKLSRDGGCGRWSFLRFHSEPPTVPKAVSMADLYFQVNA